MDVLLRVRVIYAVLQARASFSCLSSPSIWPCFHFFFRFHRLSGSNYFEAVCLAHPSLAARTDQQRAPERKAVHAGVTRGRARACNKGSSNAGTQRRFELEEEAHRAVAAPNGNTVGTPPVSLSAGRQPSMRNDRAREQVSYLRTNVFSHARGTRMLFAQPLRNRRGPTQRRRKRAHSPL